MMPILAYIYDPDVVRGTCIARMKWTSTALYFCAYATAINAAASWIVPGAVWTDTNGVKIDAHGGMIIKPGNVYYWVRFEPEHSQADWSLKYNLSTGGPIVELADIPSNLLVVGSHQLVQLWSR